MLHEHILIIAIIDFALGLYILFKNPKKQPNVAFALLSLNFTLWLVGLFLLMNSHEYKNVLVWGRLTFTGGMLAPAALLHFIKSFPDKKINFKKIWLLYSPGLISLVLSITPLVIKDVKIHSWGLEPVPGIGYAFVIVYFISYIILSIISILKEFLKSKNVKKMHWLYILFGFPIPVAHVLTTNIILPLLGFKNVYVFGPWATIEMCLLFSYAILKYRLLEVEIIFKRTSIYLMLAAFISCVYIFFLILPLEIFKSIGRNGSLAVMFISAIIIALTIQPLREWLDRVTDRFFFQKKYDYTKILEKVSKQLNTVMHNRDAYDAVMDPMLNEMHLKGAAIYLHAKPGDEYFECQKKDGNLGLCFARKNPG